MIWSSRSSRATSLTKTSTFPLWTYPLTICLKPLLEVVKGGREPAPELEELVIEGFYLHRDAVIREIEGLRGVTGHAVHAFAPLLGVAGGRAVLITLGARLPGPLSIE